MSAPEEEPNVTGPAASQAVPEPPANNLYVLVKAVTNLPSAFTSFGVDAKGVVTSNPADHVFTYALQCEIPAKKQESMCDSPHPPPTP